MIGGLPSGLFSRPLLPCGENAPDHREGDKTHQHNRYMQTPCIGFSFHHSGLPKPPRLHAAVSQETRVPLLPGRSESKLRPEGSPFGSGQSDSVLRESELQHSNDDPILQLR
jgi:hypothetical protein